MSKPAAAALSVTTRRVPATRPGFVRYELEDVDGTVAGIEVRADHDHADLELYVRAYLRRYSPRARRAGLRLVR
jgi:hypothetical protein